MKKLKGLLVLALLIATTFTSAQESKILTEREYFFSLMLDAYEEADDVVIEEIKSRPQGKVMVMDGKKAVEYSKYKTSDGDTFHFVANNKVLTFGESDGSVSIKQESRHKKFCITASYSHKNKEILSVDTEDGVYITEVLAYESSTTGIDRVIALKSYFEDSKDKPIISYVVVASNKNVYKFLQN